MPYIPATQADRQAMLGKIGLSSIDQLFSDIPEALRFPPLDLPKALSEPEILKEAAALSRKNLSASAARGWFLGAGIYDRFIPSVVDALSSRGEFLTAYTPYQPEVSQGSLQAIYEYQSMAARLLGVEVVNASHYDGATALAEALLMAYQAAGGAASARRKAIIPSSLHPEYREVIQSYCEALDLELQLLDLSSEAAAQKADESTFCVVAPYPAFDGSIPDLASIAEAAHKAGALLAVHADPLLCALLKSPGQLGADIVAAEGQSLGNPMSFGGPCLGMLGCSSRLVRKMPGRLVGEARDEKGRRGFVLTLTAREQHIRREKAVSNICSNQGLSMLRACIYLAAMGPEGLRQVAKLSWDKAHYAAQRLASIPGCQVPILGEGRQFFDEFILKTPKPAQELYDRLAASGMVPGLPLSRYFPQRGDELLVCVTENRSRQEIDTLAQELEEALA